ncbi:MMPL family transporter [Streptomonospora nanhaiensis]|uniref:MMPL family transporter n=1 Tax=Streptomonospora nanhaiensis TaxID=1323731 RepID=UPI001C38BE19|nr:MMPL family transporter [Streptomonospora nanhaiensis]MBV2362916.1 MMPL family transporter [Streptomonospora nanhaiensis]
MLAVAVLFIVLGGVWGAGAGGTLGGGGGLDDPHAESTQADEILQEGDLGRNTADVIVVYESDDMTVDDPEFRRLVEEAVARVPADAYDWQRSHWDPGPGPIEADDYVSEDRHKTYITFQLPGSSEEERVEHYQNTDFEALLEVEELEERFGGLIAVNDQFNGISAEDLGVIELVATPLLLVLLLFVFRSVIAALLPLSIAIVVAVGSLAVLRLVGGFVDLSTIAINVVIVLGLGLATDYALLIVNRFREQLAKGQPVAEAVTRTMATAGRTVVVSGLTVAATLGGLLVFPSRFLMSLAWAGVSVVIFAVIAAVTVLPALLYIVGPRVNSLRVPLPRFGRRRDARHGAEGGGQGWYRTAHAVMRRPVLTTVSLVLVLITLGLPLLSANWARPAEWALPPGTDSLVVTEELAEDFGFDPSKIVTVVVRMPGSAEMPQAQAQLEEFTDEMVATEGITRGSVTGTDGDLARITLYYLMDPMGPEAGPMTEELRALDPPEGAEALFTNRPFGVVDMLDMLWERLIWMGLIIAVVSFVVLFMAFGSVILPIKTLVLNALSLSAAYGGMVLIFQEGYLSGLLRFESPGYIDANMPLLVAAVAFGLAMDYEVFMLARIRENYLKTGDTVESVAYGVQHTARIVTAAAILLGVVVASFMLTRISVLMMIGVGLVIALAVDVTIVRGLLVPATMRLLGRWAWWAPAPMARWWQRWGIPEESGDDDDDPAAPGTPPSPARDSAVAPKGQTAAT